MKKYGCSSVCEFLGNFVVYRNLIPYESRLPSLGDIRSQVGLPEGIIPRKSTVEYARVIIHMLKKARTLDAPGCSIENLVYIGDTRGNDGTAFINLCRAGDWRGLIFIGSENESPLKVEIDIQDNLVHFIANQWEALKDFASFCGKQGVPLDERTVAVIDIDKTALGARGRNGHVIDQARVEAAENTVNELLHERFDSKSFQAAYNHLNQPEFHFFTTDNQDYLAYICLLLGSGLFTLDSLLADLSSGLMTNFEQFIGKADRSVNELPPDLQRIHRDIYTRVQAGNPTPFVEFRYNEYQATVRRMGCLSDSARVEELLEKEIVITQEVRQMALAWKKQGVLLFGLSDKPDEASIPTVDLAAKGYRPIHQVETHVIGG
ncbi:hypothetical protein ACFLRM_04960 [Acidobacteriota bacterium]